MSQAFGRAGRRGHADGVRSPEEALEAMDPSYDARPGTGGGTASASQRCRESRARPRPGDGAMDARLWASAGLNAAITAAEVVGGLASGSVSLLSDAAHNASDVMAVVLALWARRLGRRPPTARHTYGFRRAEVMAALANAVTLIVVTALIAREAVQRLLPSRAGGRA